MTIIVTNHAVERYAERVMGMEPETLNVRARALIRAEIASVVRKTAMPGQTSWRVKRPDATFVVRNLAVTTILFPWHGTKNWASREINP